METISIPIVLSQAGVRPAWKVSSSVTVSVLHTSKLLLVSLAHGLGGTTDAQSLLSLATASAFYHADEPSPGESWYLPFTEVKLKPQWGESRCFDIENVVFWERGDFPWKRCYYFRLTLFQLPMTHLSEVLCHLYTIVRQEFRGNVKSCWGFLNEIGTLLILPFG